MIWLGYPDTEGGSQDSDLIDNAKDSIEKVTTAHEAITNLETGLLNSMKDLDESLKKEEKGEWIDLLKLNGVDSGKTWAEVGGVFQDTYSMEGLDVEEPPDAFCTDCGSWIARGGESCPEHGSGDNIVLAYDVNKLKGLVERVSETGSVWTPGSYQVPFGRFDSEGIDRVEAVIADNSCSSSLSDFKTEVENIVAGMNDLTDTMEEMRRTGAEESGTDSGSDVKGLVKDMKALKIITVDNVVMNGKRWFVEHNIPGRSGVDSSVPSAIIQDMGRSPMRITFEGVLTGDNTLEENDPLQGPAIKDQVVTLKVELLKWFYKKRAPLFFASDFINRADIATKVMIEDLQFMEENYVNHQVRFRCTLLEYSDVHWQQLGAEEGDLQGVREGTEIWAQFQTLNIVTSYRHRYEKDPETLGAQTLISGGDLI